MDSSGQGGVEPLGMPAEQYAALRGIKARSVVRQIERGALQGRKVDGSWWVIPREQVIELPGKGEPLAVAPPVPDPGELARLQAMADYNARIVAPWAERVKQLEGLLVEANRKIGGLERENRLLKRRQEGLLALVDQWRARAEGEEEA